MLFNPQLLKIRKNRIAIKAHEFNFLKQELAVRTAERLLEIKNIFPITLEIGSGLGELQAEIIRQHLSENFPKLWQSDYSLNFLKHNHSDNKINLNPHHLPFTPHSFNSVISILYLHNINDLPAVFTQIHKIIKTSGFFFLVMPIMGTLHELKLAMSQAELELFNGISPHIHPFLEMQSIANILHATGFKAITADKDKIEIMYKDFKNIFKDLKGYAESNILLNKSPYYLGKKYFDLVATKYKTFQDKSNAHYPVTIEYCNIIAWKE